MRLFVSVDLPSDICESIEELQSRFEPAGGLRFTDPHQSHVTLKFLGDVPTSRVPAVVEGIDSAITTAHVDPFDATVAGLGVFPEIEYIRVLWVGFSTGGEQLTHLARAVETALTDRGFEEADHEFTPHVTFARMAHAGGKDLVQRLVTEEQPELGTFTVEEVCLTESTLGDTGPEYETVERFSLS